MAKSWFYGRMLKGIVNETRKRPDWALAIEKGQHDVNIRLVTDKDGDIDHCWSGHYANAGFFVDGYVNECELEAGPESDEEESEADTEALVEFDPEVDEAGLESPWEGCVAKLKPSPDYQQVMTQDLTENAFRYEPKSEYGGTLMMVLVIAGVLLIGGVLLL